MRQSRKVHEEVGDKLALGYENLGEQTVKNIAKPVRVFRVLTEGGAATRITTKYPPGAAVRVRLSPGRASAPRRYSVPDTARVRQLSRAARRRGQGLAHARRRRIMGVARQRTSES